MSESYEDELDRKHEEKYNELKKENKAFKKILDEIKEVEKSSTLPDGDGLNIPTSLWLEELIQTFEATKETMKGGETNHEKD